MRGRPAAGGDYVARPRRAGGGGGGRKGKGGGWGTRPPAGRAVCQGAPTGARRRRRWGQQGRGGPVGGEVAGSGRGGHGAADGGGGDGVGFGVAGGLGALAGGIAAAVTNPLDVVKTRLQTQPGGVERMYTGVFDCMRRVVREEGWGALGRGVGARVAWVAPSSAIVLAVFEATGRALGGGEGASGEAPMPEQAPG